MTLPRWTAAQMAENVAAGGVILVELRADWCPQCGSQEEVLSRLQPDLEEVVTFATVDVTDDQALPARFGVQGLPAFLLYAGGDLKDVMVGFHRAPQVRAALRPVIEA